MIDLVFILFYFNFLLFFTLDLDKEYNVTLYMIVIQVAVTGLCNTKKDIEDFGISNIT